jgi:hypothetical protein
MTLQVSDEGGVESQITSEQEITEPTVQLSTIPFLYSRVMGNAQVGNNAVTYLHKLMKISLENMSYVPVGQRVVSPPCFVA